MSYLLTFIFGSFIGATLATVLSAAYFSRNPKCKKCGQRDIGQTGEYPCDRCGLPTVWDGDYSICGVVEKAALR